jgi:hypothetical protein
VSIPAVTNLKGLVSRSSSAIVSVVVGACSGEWRCWLSWGDETRREKSGQRLVWDGGNRRTVAASRQQNVVYPAQHHGYSSRILARYDTFVEDPNIKQMANSGRVLPSLVKTQWRNVATKWNGSTGRQANKAFRNVKQQQQFFSSTPLRTAQPLRQAPNYRAQYHKKNADIGYYMLRSVQ